MKTWRVVGINFDHFHMGDLLQQAFEHPRVEIVGMCDEQPARMEKAVASLGIPANRVYTDEARCLAETRPDIVILCPSTAAHAEWVERVAPFGVNVLLEKPFAATLADADRMIRAVRATGKLLLVNWPLAWYPPHVTSKRLIDEGVIGKLIEVHYYDGNRGPTYHAAGKEEIPPEEALRQKQQSWFYRKDQGGGSLLDYLGYGTTLGSWFLDGKAPLEVTAVVDEPAGLEVDEHSITIARYADGLSQFETRWGTFTDPWTLQPQPKCGFTLVGTAGTITSYDYEPTIRLQTRAHPEGEIVPVDKLEPPRQNPIQYLIHCLENDEPVRGPVSPEIGRLGQQIVDSAVLSAREKRTVRLLA